MDKESKRKLHERLNKDVVEFFILPTPQLRKLIVENKHPIIKGLSEAWKATLLQDKGVAVRKDMVMKYVTGTLDGRNAFLLSNCEIRAFKEGAVIHGAQRLSETTEQYGLRSSDDKKRPKQVAKWKVSKKEEVGETGESIVFQGRSSTDDLFDAEDNGRD